MLSPFAQKLSELLDSEEKLAAMVAPSFVIDFDPVHFVGMLKRLGFGKVIEVSKGAYETNRQLWQELKKHPDRRYITAPCPTIVRLIRTKFPYLIPFLAFIDSPMSATARIVKKDYPDYKPVFIGPCIAKKMEAKEDWPDLDILAITYKELKEVFDHYEVKALSADKDVVFDESGPHTRLYPISGGLAQSAGINERLTDEEYDVVSEPLLAEKALRDFKASQTRLLDILYCNGGCISGPGIMAKDNLETRRQKIIKYWNSKDK